MSEKAYGIECGVVQRVKRNTLRWFGHVERIQGEEFVKKVYGSEVVGRGVRGRPPVRWQNRVEEYVKERNMRGRGGLDRVRRECLNREDWRLFCRATPLGGVPRGSEASEL
ncbi:hypothetical protein Pmani_008357 [Petrolisthes manimaculis]|uniref:Uncharacterized protein n=1 Tax=Petrolisthes manimaculis TaxID=1843537 RepID=A0AAE1Q756_9EUCA|nr:hypothetical protein Pmani_008357 [Petrolisthes manimaculis]